MAVRTFISILTPVTLSLSLVACGGAAPPAEPPSIESPKETTESFDSSTVPSSLEVVEAMASKVASQWNTEAAKAEEVQLVVRLRVNEKSASVSGSGEGAKAVTGAEVVSTRADVTVDVPLGLARDIADGQSTLKAAFEAGSLTVDNEDGLKRFFTFVKE